MTAVLARDHAAAGGARRCSGTTSSRLRCPRSCGPTPKTVEGGFWGRWARRRRRRPWWASLGALAAPGPADHPVLLARTSARRTSAPRPVDHRAPGLRPDDRRASASATTGRCWSRSSSDSPPKPSSEYTSQQQQAQSLQKQLEQEQKQGKSQQAQLTAQANALNAQSQELTAQQKQLEQQQGSLQAQQADLERQAKADTQEQAQLQASANKLEAEQVALNKQIAATGSQARSVVSKGAKITKELTSVVKKLAKNQADQRKVEAQIEHAKSASQKAKLQAKLRALQGEESKLENQLSKLAQEEQANLEASQTLLADAKSLREQEVAVANRAIALAGQAAALATDAVGLVKQKQALVQQAATLQVQAANLQTQAANLQTQAAQLQTQQAKLQGQQQTAQGQQQQAEQLKNELTDELTKAGGDPRGTDPQLVNLQDALAGPEGVKVVSPPRINKPGDAATFTVIATTAPAAPATADLVKTLRVYTIPQAIQGTSLVAFVGGQTASYVDLADGISSRLLLVIAVVIGLSFFILLAAFRSFLFAVQAAVANVLSVTASFGVLTAVFQKGWGLGLVGLDTASGTDPIASYVPLMMFAVLFGLSMDYQVFLISRIEQHRAEGGNDRDAIRRGLAGGARVIVAAALIMICVFGELRPERRPDGEAVRRRPLGGRRARRDLRARVRARRCSCWPARAAGGCPGGSTGFCRTWTSRAPAQTRRRRSCLRRAQTSARERRRARRCALQWLERAGSSVGRAGDF